MTDARTQSEVSASECSTKTGLEVSQHSPVYLNDDDGIDRITIESSDSAESITVRYLARRIN